MAPLTICNKKYFTYELNNKLQYKLNKKINAKSKLDTKCTEITLPDNKHISQRINLISCLIGSYAVNNLLKSTRFYKIPYLTRKINSLLKYKLPDMGNVTVRSVIDKLQARGIKVFIHGGLIRDIFIKVKSYDIDLSFDADIYKIIKICEEENYPCGDIDIMNQYVNFGVEKGNSLEGANLQNTFLTQKHLHEASINDLTYDLQNDILIDITGFGLVDVINNQFRLSATPKYWLKWAESDFKRPLRYFKLIQKGFIPVNQDMHNFVIDYIYQNYNSLYNKKISPRYPVTRIKHFLIKTITQGDINTETGEYTFGPTESKLLPYLFVLRQYLPRDIFVKIISNFSKEDLKKLKNKNIVSTIKNYLEDE